MHTQLFQADSGQTRRFGMSRSYSSRLIGAFARSDRRQSRDTSDTPR